MGDGWKETTLGALYRLESARLDPASLDPATCYLGLEHVESGNPRPVAQGSVAAVSSSVTPFLPGDVLFGRLRPYLKKVVLAQEDGVCTPEILVLRPIKEVALPGFLHAMVSSDAVVQRCVEMSAGSRMPRTSAVDLASLPALVPPLDVQRRIVDLIAAVDEAIDASRGALAAVRNYERAVTRVEFESSDCESRPLRSLCEPGGIQIGPFGSQLHASDYVTVGIPSIMPKDIVNGQIKETTAAKVSPAKAQELARHRLLEGDILLPRRGDLTKRTLIGDRQEGWLCGTGTVRLRARRGVDPRALFRAISTGEVNHWLSDRAVGATMPNLNTAIVGDIPVRLPDDASLVLNMIDETEGLGTATEGLLQNLTVVRSALLADLLSGEHEISDSYDELLSA